VRYPFWVIYNIIIISSTNKLNLSTYTCQIHLRLQYFVQIWNLFIYTYFYQIVTGHTWNCSLTNFIIKKFWQVSELIIFNEINNYGQWSLLYLYISHIILCYNNNQRDNKKCIKYILHTCRLYSFLWFLIIDRRIKTLTAEITNCRSTTYPCPILYSILVYTARQ